MASPTGAEVQPAQPVRSANIIAVAAQHEISSRQPETDESQALFKLEKSQLENEKLRLDNERQTEELNDLRADRALRERYADSAFRFLRWFAFACALVLICQGIEQIPFKLSNEVVITLIGATAASVIGLVGWVARGLFKAPK